MSVMRGQCNTRPMLTFPAVRHHRPLASTKLYCLLTEARVLTTCSGLPSTVWWLRFEQGWPWKNCPVEQKLKLCVCVSCWVSVETCCSLYVFLVQLFLHNDYTIYFERLLFFTIQFTFCEHTNAVGWATGNIWPTNSLLNSHKGSHFVGHIQARSAVESGLVKQKLKVAYYCFCFLCLTCLFFRDPSMQRCPLPVVSVFGHDAEVVDSCLPCILHWLDWREWVWYPKDWTYPLLHEGSGLQYLVLRHQAADQDQTLQRVLYILLVLMYSADTWSIKQSPVGVFMHSLQWCLQHILCIPYTAYTTNDEVGCRSSQPPVTSLITFRRLYLFGHIARAVPSQDHVCSACGCQSFPSGLVLAERSM